MTLTQLLLYIAIFSVVLTAVEFKIVKNYFYSFLQNFVGTLFVVSGAVKVVDPLGTAFKMQDYFEQFHLTFEETWLSFIAPMFPFLSKYAVTFAMIVIVFEIILGVMLLLGYKSRLTSWLLLLLVLFFTLLTGFTFLTGYVPTTSNFFEFSQWQAYDPGNMRVTDCGCFGDFIILEPRISFLKDIFLLIPAFIFIFFYKKAHKLFNGTTRLIITVLMIILMTIYGISNFAWDIPDFDFRPFHEGQDVLAQREKEEQAMADVSVTAFIVKNTENGDVTEVPYEEYMAEYSSKYNKEKYKVVEQKKSKPAIESTKISELSFFNKQGEDKAMEFLHDPGYTFMLISYKLIGDVKYEETMVRDTSFIADTVIIQGQDLPQDTSFKIVKSIDTITSRQVEKPIVQLEEDYKQAYAEHLNPIMTAARDDGYNTKGLMGGMSFEVAENLLGKTGGNYPVYTADDITLKTIIRSNPGMVLWKDGKILQKWHFKQIPTYKKIKKKYLE